MCRRVDYVVLERENKEKVNSDHNFQSEQLVILETLDNQSRHFKSLITLVAKSTSTEPKLNIGLHQRGAQE